MEIILDKIESIKRCLSRINEEYDGNSANLNNFTKQDSIVLNIQRACELSIDIANYIISKKKFKIPKTSRESFEILQENKIIDMNLSLNLQKMVGFRNIAVHNYKVIKNEFLVNIIEEKLVDFEIFIESILKFLQDQSEK